MAAPYPLLKTPTEASKTSTRAGRKSGFTLLEVLAATMIVGLFFTMLLGINISGLRAEGTAIRQLRASMLADERMATIEATMTEGAAPPRDESVERVEGFKVTTKIGAVGTGFGLSALRGGGVGMLKLLKEAMPRLSGKFLRGISVKVEWREGKVNHAVQRTTFAFDAAAAAEMLTSQGILPEDDGEPGGETGTPDGPDNQLQNLRKNLPPELQNLVP